MNRHHVDEASTSRSASRLFDYSPADLVITNLTGEEHNSLGLIMQLKLRKPDVKIITIFSGAARSGTDYIGFSEHLGAIRAFAKPVDLSHIADAVAELIRNRQ